jgi:hypothetical protein
VHGRTAKRKSTTMWFRRSTSSARTSR